MKTETTASEIANRKFPTVGTPDYVNWMRAEIIKTAIEVAEEYAALKASQWIDVNEMKPEHEARVLVFGNGNIATVWFYADLNEFRNYGERYFVTHWQPLPNPPEV